MKLSRMLSSSVETNTKLFKVLFCGHEFSSGYLYSKEAMSLMNNVITVQCSRENLHKEIVNANVIVPLMCRMQQKEIDLCQNLDMIMQYGVGLEGVDIPYATEKGIYVCNIPSENTGNAQSCAEHAIFLSLSLLRDTYAMNISLKSGGLGDPIGRTLFKSTAIIYGYGGIGKQLKQRLLGFDMNIIIISRSMEQKLNENNTEKERNITYIHPDEMATTPGVKEADLVYICCSQNKDNIGLVNKQFIELLKPGVLVVNVARVSTLYHYITTTMHSTYTIHYTDIVYYTMHCIMRCIRRRHIY